MPREPATTERDRGRDKGDHALPQRPPGGRGHHRQRYRRPRPEGGDRVQYDRPSHGASKELRGRNRRPEAATSPGEAGGDSQEKETEGVVIFVLFL